MISLDNITNENNKKHNEKWSHIPDHLYRVLINEQDDTDKICLYAKDLSESKYELFIKNCKNVGNKYLNDSSAFIECSYSKDDVYENIDHYNPSKKRKILIVFHDMITEIMTNKKFQAIIK